MEAIVLGSVDSLAILICSITMLLCVIIYLFLESNKHIFSPIYDRVSKLVENDKEDKHKQYIQKKDLSILYGPAIGLLFGFTITLETGGGEIIILIFTLIGFLINIFLRKSMKKTEENKLRAEVAILYEVVDFYTTAGYTLPQSLQLGSSILPRLNPIINKVLSEWPQGSFKALQIFSDNIELNEAIILVSILQYIDESGIEYGKTAIEEEARQLELVRKTSSQMEIINKPLYYSVYRILPVASLAGIVLGPLLNRISIMLQLLGGGF